MLESLNGGKPIKESRDVDLPLAAAHFFYYAGWADKLEYAFPNRHAAAARRRRPDHPVELPAADARVEDRAGARRRATRVVLKPAETTPLTALALLRRPRGRPSSRPASSTSSPATARPARRSSTPSVDKIAFTGSTEVGKAIQRAARRHAARSSRSSSAARRRTSSSTTRALDQAVEGIVNGIYFNQGHVCCAGSRLLVQESIARARRREARSSAWRRCASAIRSTRTPTSARSTRARSSRRSASSSPSGSAEGAEIYQPPCRLPEKGYWFAPTVFTNVAQSYRIAREEIFGPVLSVLTFRTPDEAVEKANNTPYGLSRRRLDGQGLADPLDGRAAPGRRRLGEHVQPLRPELARSAATRSPASAARAAGTGSSPTCAFDR